MSVQAIQPTTHKPVFKRKKHYGEKEQPTPVYFCASCQRLKPENRCECLNRYVEPEYNRCFFHSHYQPITAVFKVPENLDEIVAKEEALKRVG